MMPVKCPRCELNYIQENEKYCKICQRERHGEPIQDEMELCSICNAAPALPGKDVCLSCQKEILAGSREKLGEEPEAADENAMGLNSVSTMDEIIPQIHEDIPEREYGEIASELSLESVIEDEDGLNEDANEE